MARQRAGIGEACEVGEVDPGARDNGVEVERIHLPRQPLELYEIFY
jgi:hypothetical protein